MRCLALLISLALSAFAAPVVRQLSKNEVAKEIVFELEGVTYLTTYGTEAASLYAKGSVASSDLMTVTGMYFDTKSIDAAALKSKLDMFLAKDDVFTTGFMANVLLTARSKAVLTADAIAYLLEESKVAVIHIDGSSVSTKAKSSKIKLVNVKSNESKFPLEGPFTAVATQDCLTLAKVYKLYIDTYRTFVFGTYPISANTGSYNPFLSVSSDFEDPLIPVPSRLYTLHDDRPLAGLRFGVKDLYDVAGLQTAAGSRAYVLTYPPAVVTAPSAQKLLDLGAIYVGKTKTAQYASGASYNDLWIEVQYPFNPRGDGWQTCSASSSGSGCALAAYDWLDYTIGTDTGSSVRRPAAVSGVYGNRPTSFALDLTGVVPLSFDLDTAGLFSRSPVAWGEIVKLWYRDSALNFQSYSGLPGTILYPTDYLPLRNPAAQVVLEAFLDRLTSELDMQIQRFNFTETVQAIADPVLSNFTALAAAIDPLYSTQWFDIGIPVTEKWAELYDGRFPITDPARRANWKRIRDANYTAQILEDGRAVRERFATWFDNDLVGASVESCSDSILIYDVSTGGLPSYREQTLNTPENNAILLAAPFNNTALNPVNICSYVGCPDHTIQIGQVPYMSLISEVEEQWPVSLSIVARRGCDFMLLDFAKRLSELGMLQTMKTGRSGY